jgi:acyl CoA:acetate/3-ketoacid CoA transferase alpha subunit
MRSAQNGIPAFFTLGGQGTVIQNGNFTVKLPTKNSAPILSKPKYSRYFNGKQYILVEALKGDYAFIKCYQADRKGNLRFRKTSRNFNGDAVGAARITIAEAENIVDSIPPEKIHVPGIFVDRVFKAEIFSKKIERLTIREEGAKAKAKKQQRC